MLQGDKATIFIADLQAGYLLNPATNLKAFINVTQRSFDKKYVSADYEKKYYMVNFRV
jgi:hypothetical protein